MVLFRWMFFQFLNALFEQKDTKQIEYYLNQKDKTLDKNGFNVAQKNLFIAFMLYFMILIDRIENQK